MPSPATFYIAIDHDDEWSFFVDGPTRNCKIVLSVTGSYPNFSLEKRNFDPRTSGRLSQLVHLCSIRPWMVRDLENMPASTPIPTCNTEFTSRYFVVLALERLDNYGFDNWVSHVLDRI